MRRGVFSLQELEKLKEELVRLRSQVKQMGAVVEAAKECVGMSDKDADGLCVYTWDTELQKALDALQATAEGGQPK